MVIRVWGKTTEIERSRVLKFCRWILAIKVSKMISFDDPELLKVIRHGRDRTQLNNE